MNNSNVAPAVGEKYSFAGRPNFARIIRENPGADVIIVSREDRIVTFLFSVGTQNKQTAKTRNTLETLQTEMGFCFQFDYGGVNIQPSHEEYSLPIGWASFATNSDGWIKDLRKLAQRFVALRHGKHTVETLP